MSQIIDRRLAGKGKSTVNRGRFLDRYKDRIRDAIQDHINGRSITDIGKDGHDVKIPRKDINEPNFGHSGDGIWESVSTGNDSFNKGDKVRRPKKGGGSGSGGSDSDEISEEDFVFALTKEEFLKYFFDGLALPNLVKKKLMEIPDYKYKRAGYTTSGPQSNMNVLRSMRGALGRRIALGGKTKRELQKCFELIKFINEENPPNLDDELDEIGRKISILDKKLGNIPFLDPIDLRYSNHIPVPQPTTVAVMFCVMDVSASMDEERKEIAKKFFILLYLFLTKAYEKIEVVFIRHHSEAMECTEQEFFYSRETGGTVVSSAWRLIDKIIKERYSSEAYNIYIAQASDGDNFYSDSQKCYQILQEKIVPFIQYFAYIEISDNHMTQNLWDEYKKLAYEHDHFQIRTVADSQEVYPVFRSLFEKDD